MSPVFADTSFLVALFNSRDSHHTTAKRVQGALGARRVLMTDHVLGEFLNYFSGAHAAIRVLAADTVEKWLATKDIESITPTRQMLIAGVDLYRKRPDKTYSLTDCLSMLVMRDKGVHEVLTTDEHFAQEGFVNLLQG